ncbi:M56 family metallopeptidase [Gillisia sp. JM1]|uniref:M56 family metallopeptidase n=1 Tax=Gillisia sp. JM1 TaxID=1283286 RepID=UPI0004256D5C|nr:M56 family metallopeptidase [Gillisia sp. JM1]
MESLLIYILKSAGLISLFYILYILLLKNDTSFSANRRFLLGGIFTSLVLPAVYFTKKVLVAAPEIFYNSSPNSNLVVIPETTTQGLDWWMIAGAIYLIISGFFLLRFCFRIFQILKMIHFSRIQKEGKFKIVKTQDTSGPFSFFNYIFINPKDIKEDELQLMLTHEKIHARQFHSVDMLLSNLITAVLWFNPISWFYKKSVEQNLEFIADHETAEASGCIQEYQHVLVKVSTNQYQNVLVNHFYQSFIKKRILMLNKKSSSRGNISKMSLIFPLLFAFMLTFNVKTEAQVTQKTKVVLNDVQFYPDELASVVITKNSTKAELEDFSSKFKEQGVELQFKKLKFSKEGLLTRINIKYEIAKIGDSGDFNKNGDIPIDDIEIGLSEDFKIEFRSATTMNEKNEFVIISDSSNVVLDSGKTHEVKAYKHSLSDVTIERIFIKKPSQLNPDYSFSVGNKVQYNATAGDSVSGKGRVMNVKSKNGNRMNWVEKDSLPSKQSYKISDTMHVYKNENNKQSAVHEIKYLLVLDGKVMPKDYDMNKVDPEDIKHMNVLKGKNATSKYGSKAKEGVIEISTKVDSEHPLQEEVIIFEDDTKGSGKLRIAPNNKDILVVLNGKIKKSDFDISSISQDQIKSVIVLKGESAVKKYGEKGKNGVIEITLKEKK